MTTALRTFAIAIALVAVLLCGLILPAGMALADSTPIILLSGKTTEDDITVDVILRGNEGISSMLLSLEYDRERLVLVGLEQGDALATLDLVTTNVEGPDGYAVYPFLFSWMGDANDKTNDTMLTLHFAPVGNAQGEAYVTFGYTRDRDVNYIDDAGELRTCNLMVDTLHVNFADEATTIANEIEVDDAPAKSDNVGLVVGLTVGVAAVMALAVVLPLVWRKKHFSRP